MDHQRRKERVNWVKQKVAREKKGRGEREILKGKKRLHAKATKRHRKNHNGRETTPVLKIGKCPRKKQKKKKLRRGEKRVVHIIRGRFKEGGLPS